MNAPYISFKTAKQILNVTPQTLRNWDKNNLIKTIRTPTGIRMFNREDIETIMSKQKSTDRIVVAYCRCLNESDQEQIQNQLQIIKKHYPDVVPFTDICISSNWDRPGFRELVKLVASNKVSKIIVTNENVISRVSFQLVKLMCEVHDTEIVIIDEGSLYWSEKVAEEFMKMVKTFVDTTPSP